MLRRRDVLCALGLLSISIVEVIAAGEGVVEEPWSAGGLAGTLTRPGHTAEPGPAILIIAGSGPTDRNGNSPGLTTNLYRMLAHGLAAEGVRSLRYDKRGVGVSAGLVRREDELTFEQFVNDAVNAAHSLAARKDVSAVVLLGHSEGGIVAIRAAQRFTPAGIVLAATPGRPFDAVLRTQLDALFPAASERAEALRILDAIASGTPAGNIPPALQPLFRPSVQPFLRSLLRIDPAAELARLSVPVLLLQGGRDIQVSQGEDFARLSNARKDAWALALPTANHALKPAPTDRPGNIKAYAGPVLDPAVMPALVAFVRAVTGR